MNNLQKATFVERPDIIIDGFINGQSAPTNLH